MPDSASNPFAEPDFSSIQPAGGAAEADDEEIDDDAEDIDDETEDIDDDFEDEELDEVLDEEDVDDDEPEIEVTTAIVPGAEMDEDGAGNRVAGGTALSVLEHVARSIVDDPDGVVVDVSESRNGIHLALHVARRATWDGSSADGGARRRLCEPWSVPRRPATARRLRSTSSTEHDMAAGSGGDANLRPLLEVGTIARPHGLLGEVVVSLVTNRLERLARGAELTCQVPGAPGARVITVRSREALPGSLPGLVRGRRLTRSCR